MPKSSFSAPNDLHRPTNANRESSDRLPNYARVSASDFVRHFGEWQDHASRHPVFILHRGRPRLVLASVEAMRTLGASSASADSPPQGPAIKALLDLHMMPVLIFDAELRLTLINAAANRYFGYAIEPGAAIAAICAPLAAPRVTDAAGRVASSRIAETIEIAAASPERMLSLAISPFPGGIAVLVEELTMVEELAAARAEAAAGSQALAMIDAIATARLDARGRISAPNAGLAKLAGLPAAALDRTRFTSLVAIETRSGVADAIETLLATGQAIAVDSAFLQHHEPPRPVRISLAPIMAGARIESIAVLILDLGSPPN